jgi:SAM-dependent methyltransferase
MAVTNLDALDALETLYHGQAKPEAWRPVLPYDIVTRRQVEGQQPALIAEHFAPSKVLDYGCGNGYLVAFLAELGLDVVGYDPSPGQVPPYVRHLVTTDAPKPGQASYDLVICREVLEHVPVREIPALVATLCALSSRYLYVTTRFAKTPAHFLSVDTADELDPTHVSMLNKDFLRLLFTLQGFKRQSALEDALDWQSKGRVLVYAR